MGWDISDYSGYIIKARVLMSAFPESLTELERAQSTGDDSALFACLNRFVDNELNEPLTVEPTGDWSGTVVGPSPFEPGEVYFMFSRDQLIDEKRISGRSVETDSAAFKGLKKFMKSKGIPAEELHFEEWQFGG